MRLTVACPASIIDDANQLAAVLGAGPGDLATFGDPAWQDAGGTLYAVASFEAPPGWVQAAQSALVRPAWDQSADPAGYQVNMTGADRAQAVLVVWARDPDTQPPQARADAPVGIAGMGGGAALRVLGLSRIPTAAGAV